MCNSGLTQEELDYIADRLVSGWWDAVRPVSDKVDNLDDKIAHLNAGELVQTYLLARIMLELEMNREALATECEHIFKRMLERSIKDNNPVAQKYLESMKDSFFHHTNLLRA